VNCKGSCFRTGHVIEEGAWSWKKGGPTSEPTCHKLSSWPTRPPRLQHRSYSCKDHAGAHIKRKKSGPAVSVMMQPAVLFCARGRASAGAMLCFQRPPAHVHHQLRMARYLHEVFVTVYRPLPANVGCGSGLERGFHPPCGALTIEHGWEGVATVLRFSPEGCCSFLSARFGKMQGRAGGPTPGVTNKLCSASSARWRDAIKDKK
jgi:hypothetical protein